MKHIYDTFQLAAAGRSYVNNYKDGSNDVSNTCAGDINTWMLWSYRAVHKTVIFVYMVGDR